LGGNLCLARGRINTTGNLLLFLHLFLLKKIQNQNVVALLILTVYILIHLQIILETSPNLTDRGSIEDLAQNLIVNLRIEIKIAF